MTSVKTFEFTKIIGREHIEFGDDVLIDDFAFIYAKVASRIGSHVHIAGFSSITGGESFTLEDFAGVSQGARIYTGSDDFTGWGFGNPTIPEEFRNVTRAPVILRRFVILGANSVVLPGVEIGEGSMIGAGSVVSRSLAPWGVYIGSRRVADRDSRAILANYDRYRATLGSGEH